MKISFVHFYHDSNVRHFYPHTHKRQFGVKRGSLSMDAAPNLLACLHVSFCYPIVSYLPILITSPHLFFPCPFSFSFMTFTLMQHAGFSFLNSVKGWKGGSHSVGGMENFTVFFGGAEVLGI